MNSSHAGPDPSMEAEAALWAARLDGSAISEAERSALVGWLAEDPARPALLSEFRRMSAELDAQLPALVAAGAVAMPATPPRAFRWSRRAFAGLALATAAAAALVVWLALPAQGIRTVTTPARQRDSLTLSDGSQVELNAGTSLSIETTRTERHVRLGEGEAYFVVRKDRSLPFVVDTPAGFVRVTGTIFDVRAESAGELDVTVVEGAVQVQLSPAASGARPSSATLRAGDLLSARAGAIASLTPLSASALDAALAWRRGMVDFDGVPIRELAERYARYNGSKITVAPAIANLRMGIRSSLDDLPAFYAAIGQALPDVRVTTGPDGETRITPGSEP